MVRKYASSRASRGNRPARRNDDLPAPEAPRITKMRGGAAVRQPAQPVGRLDDRRVAAEEDARVLRLQRLQAAIRGAVRLMLRAARRRTSDPSPAFSSPRFRRMRPDCENVTCCLLMRAGQRGREQLEVLPAL